MDRKVLALLLFMTIVMLASLTWASDATQASAQMDQVGNSTSSWSARILLIGFIASIGWLAISRKFDLGPIISVPIMFIIIGALLLAGPTLLGPFMASGATLR
jgi:hypothetical protein